MSELGAVRALLDHTGYSVIKTHVGSCYYYSAGSPGSGMNSAMILRESRTEIQLTPIGRVRKPETAK